MEDEAHVRLVDAHAERVGCHDERDLSGEPVALVLLADAFFKARVVGPAGEPVVGKPPGERLDGPAGHAVDDAGGAFVFSEKTEERLPLVGRVLHREEEVRAVEAGHECQGILKTETADNVRPHLRRRGGRHGADDRADGEARGEIRDLPVGGAEIAAPAGDAVGLVDDEEGDVGMFREGEKAGRCEPLGRDVEEAEAAGGRERQGLLPLGAGHRGV